MIEQTITTEYNTFYLIIFGFLGLVAIIIGLVLTKHKDNNLFSNIFTKSSDNAKEISLDTNEKFSKAHTEVIGCLPAHYEKELHYLEETVKDVQTRIIETTEDINNKLNMIIAKVAELENNK